MSSLDTIAAPATPSGRGGVGIIRISGPQTPTVARAVLGTLPKPRYAHYAEFRDEAGEVIDVGLALYFPAPHSFTGEDVLELHGHGGPVVMDAVLQTVLRFPHTRLACPGEFSERAFLNDKLDLTQAEAIADLIDAQSTQAARCAVRSLQGAFSQQITELVNALITLRMLVEAAIDFPEEDVEFLRQYQITERITALKAAIGDIHQQAAQGALLRDGLTIVIAGRPNAGKSTLLNALTGEDSAIVTATPGTTRDLLREAITLDGIPLHLIDTAGLHDTDDLIEQEGIRRAQAAIENADHLLLVIDATTTDPNEALAQANTWVTGDVPITLIRNKIDLLQDVPEPASDPTKITRIAISAKTGEGLTQLKQHLIQQARHVADTEGQFIARRRHLTALTQADTAMGQAITQSTGDTTLDLLAEDLRTAQNALNEITGAFYPDDLLGHIFSSFCIGK